jgi:hypothetical protein
MAESHRAAITGILAADHPGKSAALIKHAVGHRARTGLTEKQG